MAQLVKNLPAMRETWVWSLGREDPVEKGKATHSSILAWRIPGLCSPWGYKESDRTEWFSLSLFRASFIAQLVKNLPARQETPFPFLGQEDLLEKRGYPLQDSWASLVAQLVKKPSAMWETWVWPWVGKILWRREQLPFPVFWGGEFQDCIVHGVAKSQTWLSNFHSLFSFHALYNWDHF